MGIPIGACPDANLVVKECVRLFGKVTFYDASMKLTNRINIKTLGKKSWTNRDSN